jgi:hypothetical protein
MFLILFYIFIGNNIHIIKTKRINNKINYNNVPKKEMLYTILTLIFINNELNNLRSIYIFNF